MQEVITGLFGLSYLHDPELKQIAAAWDLRRLLALVGLVGAFVLFRRQVPAAPSGIGLASRAWGLWRTSVPGLLPAAALWILADLVFADRFLLRVFEAIASWSEGVEQAVAVTGVGWIAWGFVFGETVRIRRLRARGGESAERSE